MTTKTAELGALLYVAGDNGITGSNLATLLEISNTALRELTTDLAKKLKNDENSGLQLVRINDEYKLTTSPDVGAVIENYFQKDLAKNLSQSALEILSIIAYRQPITRIEVDEIRGVNSAGALQTLVWRGLVKIDGKKEAPGHPNLYVTTEYFLQYFGYQSLADLPLIESFEDESFDAAGEVDLFSTKGQSDKNLAKIKKEEK